MRVFRAQLGLICVRQIQVWRYLLVDEQCEFLNRMDFDAIFQLTISMSNICQSFQTLYEASYHKCYPQILCGLSSNHVRYPQILCGPCSCDSRFFLVIPYIYSLLRGGFYNASSGLWAKTLRGQIVLTKAAPAFFIKWSGEDFLKRLCIGNNRLLFLPFFFI